MKINKDMFEGFIGGALLATLWVLLVVGLQGCASAPIPCIPDIEYQQVNVPRPCIIPVALLPDLVLPEYPEFDGGSVEWASEVRSVAKERESILLAREAAYAGKLSQHNELEPQCKPTS